MTNNKVLNKIFEGSGAKKHWFRRFCGFFGRSSFTLVELLIAMVITGILGGASVSVLWFIFGMFMQTSDYVAAREEIEFVAQKIGRELTHAGLGMPNNRQGKGSFAVAFQYGSPMMSLMGSAGEAWGGPVTIGGDNPGNVYDGLSMVRNLTPDERGRLVYQGPELYYAWGVATGVHVVLPEGTRSGQKKSGDVVRFRVMDYDSDTTGLERLEHFRYETRSAGLSINDGKNPASWILLPTTRVPMFVRGVDNAAKTMDVVLAPGSNEPITGPVTGIDEVIMPQVARLFRRANGELVQVIFGADYSDPSGNVVNVLAHNIVGLHFTYDPELRMVTMYIAAKGEETGLHVAAPDWPAEAAPLPRGSRIVVNRVNWRIRN